MRDAADARMQQRIVTFIGGACVPKFCLPNMRLTCRECGAGEGHMDDLFGRLAADLGVDRAATEMAVGILLRFQKERPAEKVCAVIPPTPGVGTVTPRSNPRSRPAKMFGARGSRMGFTSSVEAVGLSADRIDAVIRESAGAARENSRDEAGGGIARAVPCHSFDV
jgi:hypothetical protein